MVLALKKKTKERSVTSINSLRCPTSGEKVNIINYADGATWVKCKYFGKYKLASPKLNLFHIGCKKMKTWCPYYVKTLERYL
jgi:hypothetical protein